MDAENTLNQRLSSQNELQLTLRNDLSILIGASVYPDTVVKCNNKKNSFNGYSAVWFSCWNLGVQF